MERITDVDEEEEDIENMENLRANFSKEELVQMCSGFARENIKLVHWLYRYHLDILRGYENQYMGGNHIDFAD